MTNGNGETPALRVALGEYDIGWHDPAGSLDKAKRVIDGAVRAGARLVMLPEMCTTGFTMESETRAEPLAGPSVERLAALAREAGVWILAGVATRPVAGSPRNSALLFDPRGELAAHYDKQRLFAYSQEDDAYEPGTTPVVTTIDGVRVAPFICYDLRFPELFRAVARDVDAILLIANWPTARRAHWDVLVRARAIENLSYMVAVNRTGDGGGVGYDGGSVAYNPWGELIASTAALGSGTGPVCADIDPSVVAKIRDRYRFLDSMKEPAPALPT